MLQKFRSVHCARFPKIFVRGSLTKILVGYNGLGDEGTTVLCDALRESKVTKVQELDLEYNDIGPDGAKAVAAMAAVVASLMKIFVGYNNISGDGAQQLAAAVLAKPALEVFSGIPLKELRTDSLTRLDLSGKGLGVPEAIVLADLLRSVSASVTEVNLSHNNLTSSEYVEQNNLSGSTFKAGDRVMHEGQELTILKEKESDGELLLGSFDGVMALANALKVTASMTQLVVWGNSLGKEGEAALCCAKRLRGAPNLSF
jgi:hypothetical protein